MARVQIFQRQLQAAFQRAARPEVERRAKNVEAELKTILGAETEGTGELADQVVSGVTVQRGKLVARIFSTAPHAKPFFRGTAAGYSGLPPSAESRERFQFWARSHGMRPRALARKIANTGTPSRMDILTRALEAFRR